MPSTAYSPLALATFSSFSRLSPACGSSCLASLSSPDLLLSSVGVSLRHWGYCRPLHRYSTAYPVFVYLHCLWRHFDYPKRSRLHRQSLAIRLGCQALCGRFRHRWSLEVHVLSGLNFLWKFVLAYGRHLYNGSAPFSSACSRPAAFLIIGVTAVLVEHIGM